MLSKKDTLNYDIKILKTEKKYHENIIKWDMVMILSDKLGFKNCIKRQEWTLYIVKRVSQEAILLMCTHKKERSTKNI